MSIAWIGYLRSSDLFVVDLICHRHAHVSYPGAEWDAISASHTALERALRKAMLLTILLYYDGEADDADYADMSDNFDYGDYDASTIVASSA